MTHRNHRYVDNYASQCWDFLQCHHHHRWDLYILPVRYYFKWGKYYIVLSHHYKSCLIIKLNHTTEFQTHRYLNINLHQQDYYHHTLPKDLRCHHHMGYWDSHLDRHILLHRNYLDHNQNHRYMHFTRYILSLHNTTHHLGMLHTHIFVVIQVLLHLK